MLAAVPFIIYYNSTDLFAILASAAITIISGLSVYLILKKKVDFNIGKREGYIIAAITWLIISAFGTLPYLFSGVLHSFSDAFFETMSGFSTTGASVFTDVETIPHGVLFWRSMTHWIGGMGIIVLTVAILPFLGNGGMQLFAAEASGPVKDKLHPRIQNTAKNLWGIYIIFTFAETILLILGGMSLFDGLCHSFGTMATGGFSTRNASLAAFSAFNQYVVIVFMIIASINFSLHFYAFRGKISKLFRDEEARMYLGIIALVGVFVSVILIFVLDMDAEPAFRNGFFQVVSIISCTGFATTDYMLWPGYLWFILFLLMFFGGSAGSTSGSIKIIRHLMLFRTGINEFKRIIHPNAVLPIRYNGNPVSQEIIFRILAFFFLYLLIFASASLLLSFTGLDLVSSAGAVASTMGGVGPGFYKMGPMGNYSEVHVVGKWILSFCMLIGRLELFTVLILFMPSFWRK